MRTPALLARLACLLALAASASPAAAETAWQTLAIDAPGVSEKPLRVRVLLPDDYDASCTRRYPVLYVQDGQDAEAVDLSGALASLEADGSIRPVIAVAIDAPDARMRAYGLSDRAAGVSLAATSEHGAIGTDAHAYSEWLAATLVPRIDAAYCTRAMPDGRALLGWSLGALHAFGMGWQYPDVFGRIGAFSPSLWVAADRGTPTAAQASRLAHRMIAAGPSRTGPGPRLFFGVGTSEETDDRDGDGVNDALDDVRDLLIGGPADAKGLRQLGFSVNEDAATRPDRSDVALYVLEGGTHDQASWMRMLPAFLRWAFAVHAPPLHATGTVESWQDVPSAFVAARHVDVWLPPSYGDDPERRYPVLYMHDGQNLFDPALSYTGIDWDVDGAMTRLIDEGRVREAIVVGVWNTPRRFAEYMPRAPLESAQVQLPPDIPPDAAGQLLSDAYLRFLVEELKPFVDRTYRTRTGRDDTFVMGSSMGGLISLYALARHPEVFAGAGAVSTHWPAGNGVVIDWLAAHLPPRETHRIYFDHGTATLDAEYAPFQMRMDAAMRAHGWREGRDFTSRVFEGAEHNERAWRDRLAQPLEFLLGTRPD